MLHALLILLSLVTDQEVMADFAHCAFASSFVSVGILGVVGGCLVIRRHKLGKRS